MSTSSLLLIAIIAIVLQSISYACVPNSIARKQTNMISRSIVTGTNIMLASAATLSFVHPSLASASCVCNSSGTTNCPKCIAAAKGEATPTVTPTPEIIYDTARKKYIPIQSQVINKQLKDNRVVVIGEVHSNLYHHRLEFDVVKAVASLVGNGYLAVGMECFYRQHQAALDRYVFSHKDIRILKKETNWDETWGYNLNMYAKLLQYCCVNQIRIIGLNIPNPVAKLVSQVGLSAVPAELKAYLPEVDLSNKQHRDVFMNAMLAGGESVHSLSTDSIEKMYQTQALWDEYMAESAYTYLNSNPLNHLVIIAGLGHVLGRVGIPDRIQSKGGVNGLKPFVVAPQKVAWTAGGDLPIVDKLWTSSDADWIWYNKDESSS